MAVVSVVVAATRLLAAAKSLWDWDEALFCAALRHYDVAAHHPHPPGFPLFIAAGHVLRFVTSSDFHALRAVVLLASIFVFPAAYALARAFRYDAVTSLLAALLFAFLPNVWFLSGTAFSDIPSLALLLAALAFLWSAATHQKNYLLGAILLGLALSFRPQNILIAAVPLLAASWARFRVRRSDPFLAFALIALITGIAYGGAAYVTGLENYRWALAEHSKYVVNVDGYRNPIRVPSLVLAHKHLLQPFGGRVLYVVWLLALAGVIRSPRKAARVLLTFAPFAIAGCFLLNPDSISRYSIAYLFLPVMLAAEGVRVRWRAVQVVLIGAIVAKYLVWTLPVLRQVRTEEAPPVRAMQWIHSHPGTIYIDHNVLAFAEELLEPGTWSELPPPAERRLGIVASDGLTMVPNATVFARQRTQLAGIARAFYFETSIVPSSSYAEFGEGWYEREQSEGNTWRWMSGNSTTLLQPLPGNGTLTFRVGVADGGTRGQTLTVTFNGTVADRVPLDAEEVSRTYTLPSRPGTANELRLDVTPVINLAKEHRGDDGRDLGVRLLGLEWK